MNVGFFRCDVCNLTASSVRHMKEHLQGRQHAAKVQQHLQLPNNNSNSDEQSDSLVKDQQTHLPFQPPPPSTPAPNGSDRSYASMSQDVYARRRPPPPPPEICYPPPEHSVSSGSRQPPPPPRSPFQHSSTGKSLNLCVFFWGGGAIQWSPPFVKTLPGLFLVQPFSSFVCFLASVCLFVCFQTRLSIGR